MHNTVQDFRNFIKKSYQVWTSKIFAIEIALEKEALHHYMYVYIIFVARVDNTVPDR